MLLRRVLKRVTEIRCVRMRSGWHSVRVDDVLMLSGTTLARSEGRHLDSSARPNDRTGQEEGCERHRVEGTHMTRLHRRSSFVSS